MNQLRKLVQNPISISCLATLLIVLICIIAYSQIQNHKPTYNSTPTTTPTVTPTIITDTNGTQTFRGYRIEFITSTIDTYGSPLTITYHDNTVYLGNTDTSKGPVYYVEVFTKSADESLQQTVTSQFLTGHFASDCTTRLATDLSAEGLPSTYQKIQIYPVNLPSACSSKYDSFDTSRFFLMDTNHPDTFVFIDINQSDIDNTIAGKNWWQTLSFYE